jgi:hypothetical protein
MDILDWKSHFILNIFGMCESGKSHLLKYLLYSASMKKEFDHLLFFTNTAFNGQYSYIPDEFIHRNYDEAIIGNYMKFQEEAIKSGKKSRGVIVFDDVLGQCQLGSKQFLTLVSQFRQFGLSIIICSQSISKIPNNIRELAQYACIFRYESDRALTNAYESFGVLFNKFDDYKKFFLSKTGDFKFLYYNKKLSTKGIDVAYKSLKAPSKVPLFKMKY